MKSVLIVEDEALVALDMKRAVMGDGYEVVGIADTCEDALAIAAMTRPSIILLDYNLAGPLNGATVARELASTGAQIVFVTAHLEHVIQEFRQQCAGFLAKPVLRDELRQLLADLEKEHAAA